MTLRTRLPRSLRSPAMTNISCNIIPQGSAQNFELAIGIAYTKGRF